MLLWYFVVGGLINTALTQEYGYQKATADDDSDDAYFPSGEFSDTFDWKLVKLLSHQAVNVLVSPLSLRLVLSILYEGSSGSTQREFQTGLQFDKKPDMRNKFREIIDSLQVNPGSENKLKLSTRVFLESSLPPKDHYRSTIKQFYDTDIVNTNFSDPEGTSKSINHWIQEATLGSIPRLTSPDDVKDMIMLLVNAVYFKGVWRHQFPKNETCIGMFYNTPETFVYIPFMTTTNQFYFSDARDLDAKIIRLPYTNRQFSMFIILPYSKGGLADLLRKINLNELQRKLYDMDKKTVQVSIPKFEFKFKASYKKIFQQFGLSNIFQNTASFPGIVQGNSSILRQLVVSDILQSTGIELDERGTIAHAATDVVIGNKIGVPDSIFNATHPFLFFIQEETNGTIIFMGKVENPLHQHVEIKNEEEHIATNFPDRQSTHK